MIFLVQQYPLVCFLTENPPFIVKSICLETRDIHVFTQVLIVLSVAFRIAQNSKALHWKQQILSSWWSYFQDPLTMWKSKDWNLIWHRNERHKGYLLCELSENAGITHELFRPKMSSLISLARHVLGTKRREIYMPYMAMTVKVRK